MIGVIHNTTVEIWKTISFKGQTFLSGFGLHSSSTQSVQRLDYQKLTHPRSNWTFIPFEVNGGKLLLQPTSIPTIQMENTLYPTCVSRVTNVPTEQWVETNSGYRPMTVQTRLF